MANRSVHVRVHAVAFFLRASPAGRGLEFLSLFESLCSSCLFELFLLVELSHVETTLAAQKACAE